MLKETWTYPWYKYFFKILTEAEMAYNTMLFMMFIAGFLTVYFLVPGSRPKRYMLLLGNMVFYIWSGIGAFVIVLLTAVTAYAAARKTESIYRGFDGSGMKPRERRKAFAEYEKKARTWITAALFVILGVWILVKICRLLGVPETGLSGIVSGAGIIVPLGISYYTLCMAAYVMDVYWQKTEAEHDFLKLFTAMTYFPYIVQGPFVRYQSVTAQLDNLPGFDYDRVCRGLQLALWGYFKKLVIADRLALFTGRVFPDAYSFAGIEIVLALVLGAVQLYADFSGCMDIIMGISGAIGIELPANFRQPFFAKSAAEFWRRWHISLGDWTKEYIYLPIAMNGRFMKKQREIGKSKGALASKAFGSFFPLFAVWLFTGLWHGTGWDYICWGMYWGIIILLSQLTEDLRPKICSKLGIDTGRTWYSWWSMIRTFLIFAIGRMWTVTGTAGGFLVLWKRILAESRLWSITNGAIFAYGLDSRDFLAAVISIVILFAADLMHERGVRIRESIASQPIVLRWVIYYAAIMAVVIFGIYGPGYDAANFVYGNF